MIDITKMANSGYLLSHAEFYGRDRSFTKILAGNDRKALASVLSCLSFVQKDELSFRQWGIQTLCKTAAKKSAAAERAVFTRLQCWRLWSLLFSEWIPSNKYITRRREFDVIHESFAKLNDRPDHDGDDGHQVFLKSITGNSRDNYISKLGRTQSIFFTESPLTPYIKVFEESIGVSVETYVNVVFHILARWHQIREGQDMLPSLERWAISAKSLSMELNISVEEVSAILKEISFTASEGRKFAEEFIDQPSEFMFFREHPLFEIKSGLFIPVEGKLCEELLFENLMYRIHKANGEQNKFLVLFGVEFERYAQQYAAKFLKGLPHYELIDEFSFGSKKKGGKSSDIIISVPAEQAVAVFELKSARPLYASLSRDGDPESIEKSIYKLFEYPIMQAFEAVQKIIKAEAHPAFTKDAKYAFVSVTMNNYPMTLYKFNFPDGFGRDMSSAMYSFDIETFEVLMRASRHSDEFNVLRLLHESGKRRDEMSAKTVFSRYIDCMVSEGSPHEELYHAVQSDICSKHFAYFQRP